MEKLLVGIRAEWRLWRNGTQTVSPTISYLNWPLFNTDVGLAVFVIYFQYCVVRM